MKSKTFAATGLATVADDSGLEIDALVDTRVGHNRDSRRRFFVKPGTHRGNDRLLSVFGFHLVGQDPACNLGLVQDPLKALGG